ncbi:DNA-protecting protein DprA [Deinococcus metallilatus]|uniref:DNA processing protein n=1 Tax=Deinococcus metallilatus TaxID=1211322 RepID=A0AAJ5F457_9DEIO|nr:DNA-processing protein DprA [Deinococcus metallilatus]MBB5294458.1 DNA processing protein [Deinococcus metallilatus]QBY10203.1 DNA-protecting protein DprA [Deinococcus metallilatus]RXJ13929.1 DNA-protecting protein DprA [Deinococcus metallilatus]TLK29894.1 DNA-protecting protein DprA [Deinococcus metallilatus]GMA15674.1 DNA-binding protein [Deinococcus metallilatus]
MTLTTDQAELHALLTLRFTPGLGPRRTENLRRHFGSAEAALKAPLTALRDVPGLDSRSVAGIGTAKPREQAEAELGKARQEGVTLLGRGLPGYPPALEALDDPPPVLWVQGNLPDLAVVPRAVGIVGTRGASPHALSLTRTLAADLARAGVVVVSGLARGVDTAAHEASVEAGGVSVGVLGSAVNVIYPGENVGLARRLTLVSEYPLGTGPAQHHFPTRNRLIAALSSATVVVEGELRSGSLITATHALECGRTVFAVPGRAGDPRAAGPHRLLREGAVLTETAQDILNELGWGDAPAAPTPDLPPEQARTYAALTTPATLDDLQAATGLALPDLQTALVMLQLLGLAEEVGGRWTRR